MTKLDKSIITKFSYKKHLLRELLQALHGTAHKHPGISKILQEIRQKYYYPGIAKHVKKWEEGCEICAKDKRVPNNSITPELLNLPERDLGPEDAMQIDLLPNLPTSGGYQTIMTAIDVFSRYLFAYLLVEATASNTAKVLIDIMTKLICQLRLSRIREPPSHPKLLLK